MSSLQTIDECNAGILQECQSLLSTILEENIVYKIQTTIEQTRLLIKALDIHLKDKTKLLNKLESHLVTKQNCSESMLELAILNIKDICYQIKELQENINVIDSLNISVTTSSFYREKTRIYQQQNSSVDQDYYSIWSATSQADEEKACWFRNYFVGKPYITLIGPIMDDDQDNAVISIVKEQVATNSRQEQFRVIVRTKQDINMGLIVSESDALDLVLQLEYSGQAHKLDVDIDNQTTKRTRPLRSISSAIITGMTSHSMNQQQHYYESTRIMRAALIFLFQDVNCKLFKELSAETTILAGLEKEFLKYDEIGVPKGYKFGVLTVKEGQMTEEDWFSNSDLSDGLEKLLFIIGKPVELKDYKGYSAGLDTKTGESGEMSFCSSWKNHEIMYHVAPLMPTRENDAQQVHKKRYIGNDIVCIVFVESKNQKFDLSSIRSQFLHVYIIVYLEVIDGQNAWRIEVLHHKNVQPSLPSVPSPPMFYSDQELRSFLLPKLINAENSSLKSDKFILPNNKARLCILKTLIEKGMEATNAHHLHNHKKRGSERPKSAGSTSQQHVNVNSFRSSYKASSIIVESSRFAVPDLPPIPNNSKSSVLRDLKSLTRRKSSNSAHQRNNPITAVSIPSPPSVNVSMVDKDEKDFFGRDAAALLDNTNLKLNIATKELLFAESEQTATTPTQTTSGGSGIRYKAHNLVNTMIGRRNSKNNSQRVSNNDNQTVT